MKPLSIFAISLVSFFIAINSSCGTQCLFKNISKSVMVSYREPLAIYKKWTNSFFEKRPLPSAIFIGTDVQDDSICSINRKWFLFDPIFSAMVKIRSAHSSDLYQISSFSYPNSIFSATPKSHPSHYDLRTTSYWLQATSYQLRATSYPLPPSSAPA